MSINRKSWIRAHKDGIPGLITSEDTRTYLARDIFLGAKPSLAELHSRLKLSLHSWMLLMSVTSVMLMQPPGFGPSVSPQPLEEAKKGGLLPNINPVQKKTGRVVPVQIALNPLIVLIQVTFQVEIPPT